MFEIPYKIIPPFKGVFNMINAAVSTPTMLEWMASNKMASILNHLPCARCVIAEETKVFSKMINRMDQKEGALRLYMNRKVKSNGVKHIPFKTGSRTLLPFGSLILLFRLSSDD
jgi:hypothetical protein